MYQYYVIELQMYQDGTYGDIKHFAYDEDETKARLKGESKYHEVLSAAAISEIPQHSAILMSSQGTPLEFKYYEHGVPDQMLTYQYYVIELQKYQNGEYGSIVHPIYDAGQLTARRKGESKYYEVLAAAAVSNLQEHAAVLISSASEPIMYNCYIGAVQE